MHQNTPLFRIQLGTLALLFVFFSAHLLTAQELYVPRDIKKAYANETRDKSGQPGKNYWQNHGKYDIKLEINPPSRTVKGEEQIIYTNNSPDTLKKLNFKLILNHHKPHAPRLWQVPEDYTTEGVFIDSFHENGEEQTWENQNDGTDKFVNLKNPLLPGGKVELTIKWHFDLSKRSGREGAISENTFFLAYFYPRVAVYDDYLGWDRMTHTGMQEFYNNFNDYKFEVTVPKDFIVWATGTLINPEEVLQEPYLGKFKQSLTSDDVLSIVSQEDLRKGQITAQTEHVTWKWEANNISDISLALSNEYNWDAASVVVDSTTMRRASAQAAYDSAAVDFQQMVGFIQHTLNWFSNHWPGVPYPFEKMTAIRGFADMEYPMMANDASNPTRPDITRFVAQHEIAHSYFPFYMGINETRFALMDEGWATTFEHLIMREDLGEEEAVKSFKDFRVRRWITNPSMEADIPIITPTNALASRAARNNEYIKTSLGYLALKDMLGDDIFKKALHEYMETWNGKHPIPWDFFNCFNQSANEDLNWFWRSWFFEPTYIDFGIKEVKFNKNSVQLEIENIGGMPAPFNLVLESEKGEKYTHHVNPRVWSKPSGSNVFKIRLKKLKNITKVSIDGGIWMDADESNNTRVK